jgi:hypothetical protein
MNYDWTYFGILGVQRFSFGRILVSNINFGRILEYNALALYFGVQRFSFGRILEYHVLRLSSYVFLKKKP